MKIHEYTVLTDGFRGQLYDPENETDKVIIVFMGGEGKFISAGLLAEKFAENGYAALALYYWKGINLPKFLNLIPLDMVEKAIAALKLYNNNQFRKISTYGISLGSILALMSGVVFKEISAVIAVSPTHIIPEGFITRTKCSGESFLTYHGKPYDFTPIVGSLSMYTYFSNAYKSTDKVVIPVEHITGNILLLAGKKDRAWPSSTSVNELQLRMKAFNRNNHVITHIYENAGHFIGVMPDIHKYKRLRLLQITSINEWLHPIACAKARNQSESDVFEFLEKYM